MFYLRVLESDFDSAQARIARMFPQFMQALQEELDRQTEILAAEIKSQLESGDPLKFRTGKSAESVEVEPSTAFGSLVQAYVRAGGDEAPYLKFFAPTAYMGTGGTGPHAIVARNARYLHFFWEKIGEELWFKSVNHPGFGEKDFITQAFSAWKSDLPAALQAAIDRIAI